MLKRLDVTDVMLVTMFGWMWIRVVLFVMGIDL